MTLTEHLTTCKQAYQEAQKKMPTGTKAILLLSNIRELDRRERRAFEVSIRSLIEKVENWVYTSILLGSTGFYWHCAINPYTITDTALDSILGNLIGDPEKLRIEYYR